MYCSCYSAIEVLQPSPLKKSHHEITKEEGSYENNERSSVPLLGSQRHEGRHDHSLNSRVGSMPTRGCILGQGVALVSSRDFTSAYP
jgi:hypothetical protein